MGASGRQTVKQNKYMRYFSSDLTSLQARGIYFILCENLNEEDLKELDEAFYSVSNIIIDRELSGSNTMM